VSMHGTFVWNELATRDVEAAKAFYAATLGWTFEELALPDGPYWVAKSGDAPVGGIGGMETGSLHPNAAESYWFGFIEVDDVDARLADAVARGATVLRAAEDVPGVGRVAVLRDPTGGAIGWLTAPSPDLPETASDG
jgi:uncharacterized protein